MIEEGTWITLPDLALEGWRIVLMKSEHYPGFCLAIQGRLAFYIATGWSHPATIGSGNWLVLHGQSILRERGYNAHC